MTQKRQDNSFPNQQKKVREWAEENGVDIVQEFADLGRTKKPLRCAIYTRTNVCVQIDGIQPQRDATRAFIKNRSGWICVGMYEDIGHSAGTMDRPALRRLLADVEAGKLDCVVVDSFHRVTTPRGGQPGWNWYTPRTESVCIRLMETNR